MNYLILLVLTLVSLISFSTAEDVIILPGQPADVGFRQFSGRITLDDELERSLFYWLVEATGDPAEKPLLLWLTGGPGCSSVGVGAFQEIGPLQVEEDGKTLSPRRFAWNTDMILKANLLFLDSPVTVGYSRSETTETFGDTNTANDNYAFLLKFYQKFPEYAYREFYIAGESYAGHYAPQLANLLLRSANGTTSPIINLKGILLGNAVLDSANDFRGAFAYWYNHGLISDRTYENLRNSCQSDSFLFPSHECAFWVRKAISTSQGIDPYSIYDERCSHAPPEKIWRMRGADGDKTCFDQSVKDYLNHAEVQLAFKADVDGTSTPWDTCSAVARNSWKDSSNSVLPILKELISVGIRIWVFSGDTDAVVPLTSTRYSINALELPITTEWYEWYNNGTVAGWSEVYQGLTYATVRGAGHGVPMHRPAQAFSLFQCFLSGEPLNSKEEYY